MLKDGFGREISNIRISLTSRCNLSCLYCHAEGESNPGNEITIEEIREILLTAEHFGVKSVKFTGGEPLLRKDIKEIIRQVPESMDSSLTTNGIFLAPIARELKKAGLSRVNISLDSLRHERYRKITGKDLLDDVLKGIDASLDAGLTPVKLNVVMLSGFNEDEIEDFIDFVKSRPNCILQLIELMHFNDCPYHSNVSSIESDLEKRSKVIITRRMHHRKKYCLDGAEIEVVRPLHNTEFCQHCNRLRVTSDCKLKPCLLRMDNHVDVRGVHGKELEKLFEEAVNRREPFFI